MLKITIKYFAALAEYAGTTQEEREITHNSIEQLYQELKTQYKFAYNFADVRVAINTSYVDANTEIKDHDVVVFITPVAGG